MTPEARDMVVTTLRSLNEQFERMKADLYTEHRSQQSHYVSMMLQGGVMTGEEWVELNKELKLV